MLFVWNLLKDTVLYVLGTLVHNLPALFIGVFVAAALAVYLDPEKMKGWLIRRSSVSIPATVAFGAFTPFCACGTMAIVLSMMATALPWGPIMAFLTSSPLMSPEGFVFIAGVVGPMFAIALAVASVVIGLGSGYFTHLIEKKTNFLHDQLRFTNRAAPISSGCGCEEKKQPAADTCCVGKPKKLYRLPATSRFIAVSAARRNLKESACACDYDGSMLTSVACCGSGSLMMDQAAKARPRGDFLKKYKIDRLFRNVFELGVVKILPLFALFAGIGFLINRFIPSTWITAIFGAQNIFAVPLAAVIGLPLYVNGDSSIPLIQSLMKSGVSGGAMLAFLITGPGTSAGVIAGVATFLKKKAIALYVGYLLFGAILLGYAYDLIFA
ncbi:MAG TPA: permease [Clostridia bacterium]|nr:permease [Clostridia bacterium]